MKKHFCMIAVLFSLVAMFYYQPVLAESDTTAPYVNSFKILTPTIPAGGTASMQLDFTETETGVSRISISFMDSNGTVRQEYRFSKEYSEPIYTGTTQISLSRIPSQLYYLSNIGIWDAAGNYRQYNLKIGENDYLLADNEFNLCTIENGVSFVSGNPVIFPEIISCNVSTAEAKKGDSMEFNLKLKNGVSGKIYTMYFVLQSTNGYTISTKEYTFIYESSISGSVVIPTDYCPIGTYSIWAIYLKPIDASYYQSYVQSDPNINSGMGQHTFNNIGNSQLRIVVANGGTSLPKVEGVTILTNEITKPGVIAGKVSVSANSGLIQLQVSFSKKGISNSGIGYMAETQISDGSFMFKVPTSCSVGDYYISHIQLIDTEGNIAEYRGGSYTYLGEENEKGNHAYIDSNGSPYMLYIDPFTGQSENCYVYGARTTPYVTVKEEFDVAFERSLNNPSLLNDVNLMMEGKTAKINITSPNIASKELFEAIQGKDKTLVFYANNYQWVFNGKEITTPKDINLDITFSYSSNGDLYNSDTGILTIVFPSNGNLPGKANIRIKSDYTRAIYNINENLYLYHVSQDEKNLEYQSGSNINYYLEGRDSWVSFYITHNSKYIASGKEITDTKLGVKKGTKFKNSKYKCTFITLGGKKVAVLKANSKSIKTAIIPAKIKYAGVYYSVTEINANAYAKCSKLENVTIEKNVTKIGSRAFYNCTKIKKIKVKSTTLKTIGKDAFNKVPKKINVYIVKSKFKTMRALLKKKGFNSKTKFKKF